MAHVLVVDDEPSLRQTVSITLSRAGHSVDAAASGEEAVHRIGEVLYDVVVTDLRMEGVDGLAVLEAVKARDADAEVLIITAHGSIESAVQTIRRGAHDYLTKPFTPDQILHAVDLALERRRLRTEVRSLSRRLEDPNDPVTLVGHSAALERCLDVVREWAESDSTILISGETGTGKDLLARMILRYSRRADRPFVVVNCATIPDKLFESELFGHMKGAFSGATRNRKGLAQEADGGTLFLDEVGELPLEVQPQLLRFLESGEVRPIGQNRSLRVDTRVIAATNRDLLALIREGRFREDLYYRLNVLPIAIPPLRERREDIPVLAAHFVERFARRLGRPVRSISKRALLVLSGYEWPGNVRELENVIERAVMLAKGNELRPEHLFLPGSGSTDPDGGAGPKGQGVGDPMPLAELERRHILAVLKACGGNQKRAAGVLGISKSTLWRKLKGYGVDAASL
ncbi:MAG: sigma-54-dependent Fis family transcriptional regulator [Planctomycetota bacterium]|nr:MAG: sigma-54-dependent Fis family transcriptional regulator [Planctomycetota bacterium]